MLDKLHDYLTANSTEKSGEATVNVLEWTGRATMDIIGIVGFGHDFQCGESPEAKAIHHIWSNIVSIGMELPGFVAPLVIRIFPWLLHLPIKAMESQSDIKKITHGLALRIIQNREATGEKPGNDLLSALLKMKDSEIDLENMLDQVRSFPSSGGLA